MVNDITKKIYLSFSVPKFLSPQRHYYFIVYFKWIFQISSIWNFVTQLRLDLIEWNTSRKKSLYINQKINNETIQGGFKNKFELGMLGYNSKA